MRNIGLVNSPGERNRTSHAKDMKSSKAKIVKCKLNTSDKEVYVPFSFIKSYFDVSLKVKVPFHFCNSDFKLIK